ncbi:hypothetical protein ACHAWF_014636 [Thalassiosira exigua]
MPSRPRRTRGRAALAAAAAAAATTSLLSSPRTCRGFSSSPPTTTRSRACVARSFALGPRVRPRRSPPGRPRRPSAPTTTALDMVVAPPGSGYLRTDDPSSTDDDVPSSLALGHAELAASDVTQIAPRAFPDTYDPSLEYPGTMRPGRTPENMPYHDLPGLDVTDPDPVPWPHFQEIEWHHRWDPPHEQALAMEEFIDVQGRWASAEDEAEMRMGMRRGVRERREEELAGKMGKGGPGGGGATVITDDDEEEEEGGEDASGMDIGLGEGVEALLKTVGGGDDDDADGEEDDEGEEDEEGDDFLLDLGLGGDDDEEANAEGKKSKEAPKTKAQDDREEGEDVSEDDLDLDLELGFDLDGDDGGEVKDGDDEVGGYDDDFDDDDDDDVSLDEYAKGDDGGDDDEFDDGGFDYGD